MPQPGKLTADGQHWVYRSEGRRKCWFQTAAEVVGAVKKPAHRHAVEQRVTARKSSEATLHKRQADDDAHAEILRSALSEMTQPTPPGPDHKVADTAPAPPTVASELVPPTPIVEPATDQLTPDRPMSRLVDVQTLAVSQSPNETVGSSVLPAIPIAFPLAEAGDDGRGWTIRLGVLLIALGLVSLLSSSLPMLVGLFSRSEQLKRKN